MQLHDLKWRAFKLSTSCSWHSESESHLSYCVISTVCSNITCWVTWTDFFSSFSSFSLQHVCLIHWCLWDCNWRCCLCPAHFNLSWNWNMLDDAFILCMLHVMCASDDMSVLYTLCVVYVSCVWWCVHSVCASHCVFFTWESCICCHSFQFKLDLRHICWLCCRAYSLRDEVMTSLRGVTASNGKRRRQATVKEEGKQW